MAYRVIIILMILTSLTYSWQGSGFHQAIVLGNPLADPTIEISNQSGVAGYPIGIFGQNFGTSAGTVTILGVGAQVEEWTDTFVKVIIPSATPGTGELSLTTVNNMSASAPFQLYTIDPAFLVYPETTFTNIAFAKPVTFTNLVDSFCFRQPENVDTEPTDFLTDYRCGYSGITGDGSATFSVASGNALLAIELDEPVTGSAYFQFFNSSSWYTNDPEAPKDYVVETSVDSTDGVNGNWQIVHNEAGNNRSARLHQISMPGGGARWVRLRVTSTTSSDARFIMKELRLYQPSAETQSTQDIFALYGDSITADAMSMIGHVGLENKIKEYSNSEVDLLTAIYGLSGQNTSGLLEQPDVDFDIYDAFSLDNVGDVARYWGIALGTNDSNDNIEYVDETWSNIGAYDERMDSIIQELIGRDIAPIIARIPDTDEAQGGFGTLATKQKILADIDRLVARYRLIPGPDMYTSFRYNIELDGNTWVRPGDGTHHSNDGRVNWINLWAEAFVNGTNRTGLAPISTATPQPTSTSTPVDTPTAVATSTPTAVDTPTSTATSTPTPVNTPTAVATFTPTAVDTPTSTATFTPTRVNTSTPVNTPAQVGTPTQIFIHTPQPTGAATEVATAVAGASPTPGTETPVSTSTSRPQATSGLHQIYLAYISDSSSTGE